MEPRRRRGRVACRPGRPRRRRAERPGWPPRRGRRPRCPSSVRFGLTSRNCAWATTRRASRASATSSAWCWVATAPITMPSTPAAATFHHVPEGRRGGAAARRGGTGCVRGRAVRARAGPSVRGSSSSGWIRSARPVGSTSVGSLRPPAGVQHLESHPDIMGHPEPPARRFSRTRGPVPPPRGCSGRGRSAPGSAPAASGAPGPQHDVRRELGVGHLAQVPRARPRRQRQVQGSGLLRPQDLGQRRGQPQHREVGGLRDERRVLECPGTRSTSSSEVLCRVSSGSADRAGQVGLQHRVVRARRTGESTG